MGKSYKMIIHAHILAYNEEKILRFTLDYYSDICDRIWVYDNMSDDSSDTIYPEYPKVTVVKWDSNNEINEMNYIKLKNNEYKKSRGVADWVIVCDCDEILYHPRLLEKLQSYKDKGITVPLISGHDMVSDTFPIYDGTPITEIIKIGSELYEPFCKTIVFNPKLDMNYGLGAHSSTSIGAVYSTSRELKLLHYKLLGFDYVTDIYQKRAKRLSNFNKDNKLGEHYFNPPIEYMNKLLNEKRKLIR